MVEEYDEDLMDAMRLASPVGEGILWHPASLDDIYAVPARTLVLFDYYRLGTVARIQPWTWWRLRGKRTKAHQYTTDWRSEPERPARCGYLAPEDEGLEPSDITKCQQCSKLDRGETTEATGTVAGVRVGAHLRQGGSPE